MLTSEQLNDDFQESFSLVVFCSQLLFRKTCLESQIDRENFKNSANCCPRGDSIIGNLAFHENKLSLKQNIVLLHCVFQQKPCPFIFGEKKSVGNEVFGIVPTSTKERMYPFD